MKALYDQVSYDCSKLITHKYSTSFSLGIRALNSKLHKPIYAIYGFVRLADEIVDSFHNFPKEELLNRFEADTYKALEEKISLNPVLNCFQEVIHTYQIDVSLIQAFLHSMRMDLELTHTDSKSYETYILGSAEVVGLMCLKIFVNGNEKEYQDLKPYAMRLGAAFQKVNFLRDLRADSLDLGRTYFPQLKNKMLTREIKNKIENEIQSDFDQALIGIKKLPTSARLGVYLAYVYYKTLFKKIKRLPPENILQTRIRVPNNHKFVLLVGSVVRHRLNLI